MNRLCTNILNVRSWLYYNYVLLEGVANNCVRIPDVGTFTELGFKKNMIAANTIFHHQVIKIEVLI